LSSFKYPLLAAKQAKPAQAKQLAASAERATLAAAKAQAASKKAGSHLNTIQEENETNNKLTATK
jgi:hypothetical protein